MKTLSHKQRVDMIDTRTLNSIMEGSVLEMVSKSEMKVGPGTPSQICTVNVWKAGVITDNTVKIIIPLRLSGGKEVFPKGSILVFMGKAFPHKLSNTEKAWCWHTNAIYPSKAFKSNEKAKNLSRLSLDEMKKMFERRTLEKFQPGTILTFWRYREERFWFE